jgi:hypothetical protein
MNLNQTEFHVTVVVDTNGGLKVEKPLGLISSKPHIRSISLGGDGMLECSFKVLANDRTEALEKSSLFANSLADLLAYLYKAQTKTVYVKDCSYKTGDGIVFAVTAGFTADARVVRPVTPDASERLSKFMQTEKSQSAEDMLDMFRQAVNEDSTALRYLLLYRLLEFYTHKKTDAWILKTRNKMGKNTEMITNRTGHPITIFSDLRHRIHGRTNERLYPYTEIFNRIAELEELVKEALDEVLVTALKP